MLTPRKLKAPFYLSLCWTLSLLSMDGACTSNPPPSAPSAVAQADNHEAPIKPQQPSTQKTEAPTPGAKMQATAILCRDIEMKKGGLRRASQAVNTGTDGGGGVVVFYQGDRAAWIELGVGLSSAFTETQICYSEDGEVMLVEDKTRYYDEDPKTGELVVNLDPIIKPGTRFFYEGKTLVGLTDPSGVSAESARRAEAFHQLAEYLATPEAISSDWSELHKVLR